MSEGVSLRSLMIERTCAQNCMGHEGNSGGCCTLGDRDFIMGPVLDAEAVLERLSALWGRAVPRAEVFIDFEFVLRVGMQELLVLIEPLGHFLSSHRR